MQTTYTVEGMTCGHCVAAVTEVLESFGGTGVAADLERGRVAFEIASTNRMGEILAALEEEGYPATLA